MGSDPYIGRRICAVDSLAWPDAERTYGETKAALADQDRRIADVRVDLFRMLAGGWS
jgi:hypothetical protein